MKQVVEKKDLAHREDRNIMIKKPREPKMPYKPYVVKAPSKTREVFQYLHDNDDIEISFQKIIEKIPKGISLDKVFIKSYQESDWRHDSHRCFQIYYLEDVENKDFDWEMEKYNKKLPLYKKKMTAHKQEMKEYKEKMEEYKEKMKIWELQEKEKEKERLKNKLAKLEKELAE
jgi:predicted RNase H-like nuclease (RuvC/YqgF family)